MKKIMCQRGAGMTSLSEIQNAFYTQLGDLPPSVAKTAEWLANNVIEVAWQGIEDVARRIGVSPATVMRTIKHFGFHGYSELQRFIRERIPASALATRMFRDHPNGSSPNLSPIGAVIQEEKANLDRLEPAIAPILHDLTDRILSAKRIFVAGGLLTAPAAQYLALHLQLLLDDASFVDSSSARARLVLARLKPTDCVIGISYPRYLASTYAFVRRALDVTDNVVFITDQDGPPISAVPLFVRIPSASCHHFSSPTSLMAFIHVLTKALSRKSPSRVFANLALVDEALNDGLLSEIE